MEAAALPTEADARYQAGAALYAELQRPFAVTMIATAPDREQLLQAHNQAFWKEMGAREVLLGLPVAAQNQAEPVLAAMKQAAQAAWSALYPAQS